MLVKSKFMHIYRSNNVTVSSKATGLADPISLLGLVFMLTDRTLATCASFGASEAHDVGLLGFFSFERSDTTACHDHGLSCIGRNGCQMDFTQVYGCVYFSRSLFFLRLLFTNMQFKAVVPDKAAGTTLFWKFDRQDDGFAS